MKGNRFACFTPPVMIATFAVELTLALYTWWRHGSTPVGRTSVLVLLGLAGFQLAEYGVCEPLGLEPDIWARVGFVTITTLPALGIDLINRIAGIQNKVLVYGAYALMALWIGIFSFGGVIDGYQCGGNYLIFDVRNGFGGMFFIYYYALLLFGIILASKYAREAKRRNVRAALFSVALGYLVFLVPTTLLTSIFTDTARGLPSIMCGFAVIFAFILSTYTVPKMHSRKSS